MPLGMTGSASQGGSAPPSFGPPAPLVGISIGAPDVTTTTAGQGDDVNWIATITNASSHNLVTGDIDVVATGSAGYGGIIIVNEGTATPTIRLYNTTGIGTLKIRIKANSYDNDDSIGNLVSGYSAISTVYGVVSISMGTPTTSCLDNGILDYPVTITNGVSHNLVAGDITVTKGGSVGSVTVSIINPTSTTPTIRCTMTSGTGACSVHINANSYVNGDSFQNTVGAESADATKNPTAPTSVNIGSPSPSSGEEGSAIIDWIVTYSGTYFTSYQLTTALITKNGTPAGTWSVINGTTSSATVRFTSTGGFGVVGFDVLAGASSNWGANSPASAPSPYATISEDEGK